MNRVSRTLTVLALLLVGCQSKTSGPRQKSEPEKTARTILESMLKAYRQTPAYRDNAVLKES